MRSLMEIRRFMRDQRGLEVVERAMLAGIVVVGVTLVVLAMRWVFHALATLPS